MKYSRTAVILLGIVALGVIVLIDRVARYFALPQEASNWAQQSPALSRFRTQTATILPSEPQAVAWEVQTVAENLKVPWGLVFPTETSVMFTERPGAIRLIQDGELVSEPLYVFQEVRSSQEQGLMGLALHPDFTTNKFVYVCVSVPSGDSYEVKVSRLIANDAARPTQLTFDRDILPGIQGARVHAGCSLSFGPDGKLYVGTGDATQKSLAQDQGELEGKILRLNDDGSRPANNPFADSLVYSRGHRNPQGLAWHANGSLYSTEHGPSVFDGPAGGDEVNRILPGEYYGWPEVSHERTLPGTHAPIALYTPAEAPSGLLAYSGKMFPQYTDNLFFAALRGTSLWRLEISATNPDEVMSQEQLFDGEYGRLRSIAEAPDGSIYFSTSNQDGRGTPKSGDDKILRLVPKSP